MNNQSIDCCFPAPEKKSTICSSFRWKSLRLFTQWEPSACYDSEHTLLGSITENSDHSPIISSRWCCYADSMCIQRSFLR